MATIKLKVSDKILDKVVWLLSQFKTEELEIIYDENFNENQAYAKEQLERLESQKGKTLSLNQVDEMLEDVIRQHES